MRRGPRGRRDSSNKALLRGLLIPLLEKGVIQTSEARAKLVKRAVDRLILQIRRGTLADKRRIESTLGINRSQAERIVARVKEKLDERPSGFTRTVRLGRRTGDNSMMIKVELITKPEEVKIKTGRGKKTVKPTQVAEA